MFTRSNKLKLISNEYTFSLVLPAFSMILPTTMQAPSFVIQFTPERVVLL